MNKLERIHRYKKMLYQVRHDAGLSQESIAAELNVSRRTYQKWESFDYDIIPDQLQIDDIFIACGKNPIPYYLAWLHSEEFDGISADDEDESIEKAFNVAVKSLTPKEIRMILYMIYGDHDGSSAGGINLMCAYGHLPLHERIYVADLICSMYEYNTLRNTLNRPDHVRPDVEYIKECIESAKDSVRKNKTGYHV